MELVHEKINDKEVAITRFEQEIMRKAKAFKQIKRKRYYSMNLNDESDDLVRIFNEELKKLPIYETIKKEGINFQLNYVSPELGKNGKVFAHVIKTSPILKFNSDLDYIVEVGMLNWSLMSEEERHILMEHELMHLCIGYNDKTGKLQLRLYDHDCIEFVAIIRKYGLEWPEKLALYAGTVKDQMDALNAEQKEIDKANAS